MNNDTSNSKKFQYMNGGVQGDPNVMGGKRDSMSAQKRGVSSDEIQNPMTSGFKQQTSSKKDQRRIGQD